MKWFTAKQRYPYVSVLKHTKRYLNTYTHFRVFCLWYFCQMYCDTKLYILCEKKTTCFWVFRLIIFFISVNMTIETEAAQNDNLFCFKQAISQRFFISWVISSHHGKYIFENDLFYICVQNLTISFLLLEKIMATYKISEANL